VEDHGERAAQEVLEEPMCPESAASTRQLQPSRRRVGEVGRPQPPSSLQGEVGEATQQRGPLCCAGRH
jgi:hypothetical protein